MNFDFLNIIEPITYPVNEWTFSMDRPVLLFLLIPALILAIVPFLRLRKERRRIVKHVVPFFVHMILSVFMIAMMTGMNVSKTDEILEQTSLLVAVDVSASDDMMEEKIGEYIDSLKETIDENTHLAVMVFAGKTKLTVPFDADSDDYFDYRDSEIEKGFSNFENMMTEALKEYTADYNKRLIVISDGKETAGNVFSTLSYQVKNANLRIDCVFVDINDKTNDVCEVQITDLHAIEKSISVGDQITLTASVRALTGLDNLLNATVKVYEDESVVHTETFTLTGAQKVTFKYQPQGAGMHVIRAEVTTSDDAIEENNTLYTSFFVEDIPSILIVTDDVLQYGSIDQIVESADFTEQYHVAHIGTDEFPETLEELAVYDKVVLMNVDFEQMPENAGDLLDRYVSQLGRGLTVTSGDNTYNYNNQNESLVQIEKLLPVKMEIDSSKESYAIVLVFDLSSSMKELVGATKSRYDIAVESAMKCIDDLNGETSVGLVLFDADAEIAIELTNISERTALKQQIREKFEAFYFLLNEDGSIITDSNNPKGKSCPSGGRDKGLNNGGYIQTFGTNYKWAVQYANNMLSDSDADIKQMIFVSDGAPSDKGSGYTGIIQQMAKSGIITSTISIGTENADELTTMANYGKGTFKQVSNENSEFLKGTLLEMAENEKGKYINEDRQVPIRMRNNSTVLSGIQDIDFDIWGYYGTTIKQGATMVFSVDDSRPLYAEWKYGLGKVSIFMSDLSNSEWMVELNADANGVKLVTNMITTAMNVNVGASGISAKLDRNTGTTKVTADLTSNVATGEELVAIVIDEDENEKEYVLIKEADKQYGVTVDTPNSDENYEVKLVLRSQGDHDIYDQASLLATGFYDDEYDLFSLNGKDLMLSIAKAGHGGMLDSETPYENIDYENEKIETQVDFNTITGLIALILFILDLIFRSISFKKKKKEKVMTDEEVIASMRGR